MKFLLVLILINLIFFHHAYSNIKTNKVSPKSTSNPDLPISYLKNKLHKNKFPKKYIETLLKYYESEERDKIIKLNTLGFLISPDYSSHYSASALEQCRLFLNTYSKVFKIAEKKYQVKKEIIVALLWVETRLGINRGRHHISSVYLNLLLSDHPEVKKKLIEELFKKIEKPNKTHLKKLNERIQTKMKWANQELWSLYQIHKKQGTFISHSKGSYSGAFGYPQFLPSSYITWGKSLNGSYPNFDKPEDSILSVAYYLKKNGFRLNNVKSYKKSLYRYNRSNDYGDIILKLAESM